MVQFIQTKPPGLMMARKIRVSPRSLSDMPASYPDINERFKETRHQAGISQEEMSREMKINLSTIKAIEAGYVTPNLHIIRRWHRIYKKSYQWIIDGV